MKKTMGINIQPDIVDFKEIEIDDISKKFKFKIQQLKEYVEYKAGPWKQIRKKFIKNYKSIKKLPSIKEKETLTIMVHPFWKIFYLGHQSNVNNFLGINIDIQAKMEEMKTLDNVKNLPLLIYNKGYTENNKQAMIYAMEIAQQIKETTKKQNLLQKTIFS